jgi:SAM-dependent methyltransferase
MASAVAPPREELKQLILRALGAQYTSVSSMDSIETGNAYQSIALGDTQTSGFREDRGDLLDRIEFEGKRVLDLGSNLGEVSRAARARGAALVDGFEYDPYFIEIADLINAYTETTRVSFFQRDISDVAAFEHHYDIVLAFAVFGQGLRVSLPRVAEICDGIMVLETHRLEGNFESTYMEPISEHFPHHRVLGQTQWGSPFDRRETRAVVVFAKEEAHLAEMVRVSPEAEGRTTPAGGPRPAARCIVDVNRTRPHASFFAAFGDRTGDELLEAVAGPPPDPIAGNPRYEHWLYYLRGYRDFLRSGRIGPGNPYYDHLVHEAETDPSLARPLRDPASAVEYVTRQFRDLRRFQEGAGDPGAGRDMKPIRGLAGDRKSPSELVLVDTEGNRVFMARVDGWHRLFAARTFGIPALPCEIYEGADPGPVRGSVDSIHVTDAQMQFSGWCLDPERRIDRAELSSRGRRLAGAVMSPRVDVRDAFPHVPHAADSGFAFEADVAGVAQDTDGIRAFEVTGFDEFLPVGRMTTYWSPDVATAPVPPDDLARRVRGVDPHMLSLRTLNAAVEMLDPVGRYRALDSFHAVLDLGCGLGLFDVHAKRFLPRAQVTAVEFDAEAIEWATAAGLPASYLLVDERPPAPFEAGSFDLVLSPFLLRRIAADEHQGWLDEIARLLRSGGYAAVAIQGELAGRLLADPAVRERWRGEGAATLRGTNGHAVTYETRAHFLAQCTGLFEVIAYREGAVNNEQDLVLLRKA